MKKQLAGIMAVGFLLSGCSSDEHLDGKREELIIPDMLKVEKDTAPTILDETQSNKEFTQVFLNSTHNYAPLCVNSDLAEIWNVKLDFEASKALKMTASPIVAAEKVFCMDAAGVVYALDQKTGARLWRVSTTIAGKDGQIGGAIAYANGKLIVTSSFAECLAFDASSGSVLWRIKLPAACKGDGITISGDKAFVMCSNSSLHAIDIKTGKIVWTHAGMVSDTAFLGCAGAAVSDGVVYLAYPSGEIYALLEETGTPLWDAIISKYSLTNSAQSMIHPRACPVVAGDLVYFVSANKLTSAFDKKTGKLVWRSDYGGVQTPSVSGNSIFVFNSKSELVCLNRYTGRLRWSAKLPSDNDKSYDWCGQLLVKDNLVIISPSGYMVFVSTKDGRINKIIEINDEDDGISVNPVVADGMLFVALNCGGIVAYK